MSQIENINKRLKEMERIINNDDPLVFEGDFQVGIDLGTADIVFTVVDANGWPIAAFLEWAEVVRDGIVLDYMGAVDIVNKLKARAEQKLSCKIEKAITSYPPGTDPRTSKNVLIAANIQVQDIIDEPSAVAELLQIEQGAVVDVGGGTTGIAVVENHKITYSADEATGGRHVTLTIAGNQKLTFEEAEQIKRNGSAETIIAVVRPVFQKMADIVSNHVKNKNVKEVYLSGGTCCFKGMDDVFKEEMPQLEIIRPYHPLYLTPLAIASYKNN